MPPSDQEPRYRLVDNNGNVVGALWGDGNGNVKIADETDTQTTFSTDGISTPALETEDITLSSEPLSGYKKTFTKEYSNETVSEDISINSEEIDQFIVFHEIAPGTATQLTAILDNNTTSNYNYNLKDRSETVTTTTGDTKIKICDNLQSDGGFGGIYHLLNLRADRTVFVGDGQVLNASEQCLASGAVNINDKGQSIQLSTDGDIAVGKIDVWEEIV